VRTPVGQQANPATRVPEQDQIFSEHAHEFRRLLIAELGRDRDG
jgi:hypothetical protein